LGFLSGAFAAAVRLVCWVKAVHDALVMRLVLRRRTTDEAVGMLGRLFPAVPSNEEGALTDEGMRAGSSLTACTSLELWRCSKCDGRGEAQCAASLGSCPRCNTPKPVGAEKLAASSPSACRSYCEVRRAARGVGRGAVSEMPN
jgi:hypothetical protein